MNPRSPASSTGGYPSKRARHSPSAGKSPSSTVSFLNEPTSAIDPSPPAEFQDGGSGGKAGQSSSFRNVSACNRCRLRKNRCDQRLPSCASCDKANVKCVGYDPITKREIPRSYVFYLETRVTYLENLLQSNNIPFAPADVLNHTVRPGQDQNTSETPTGEVSPYTGSEPTPTNQPRGPPPKEDKKEPSSSVNKLVSNTAMVSVQGVPDPRYLGSTSGISFAKVVFAAVKSSMSGSNSDKGSNSGRPLTGKAVGGGGTSMRDSFFGLQTKPTIRQAPFPDREVGLRLADLYFEHANPQIPILHRGEFMTMFEGAYAEKDRVRGSRELYMLNIVFAIGSGIMLGVDGSSDADSPSYRKQSAAASAAKINPNQFGQPEEYHASAIIHLDACMSSVVATERPDGFGGGLEELQAVLLLAGFALLRPVPPGLWYIIGVAVRLAVDLGLHYEDGKDLDIGLDEPPNHPTPELNDEERYRRENNARERGRRAWIRDFRRRLWWCTYAFDRLVSTCVGRPFGIHDMTITTEFPSLLEDKYITPEGFLDPPGGPSEPSSKHVAYHYFRLRLLQSEIMQVLQWQQAQLVRAGGMNQRNPYMHTKLPSPFLTNFDSFRAWRIDIDKRLWQWKESAPSKRDTGVLFSPEFLELNYWQAIILLYRQSLTVPPAFEGEYNTSDEVNSPPAHHVELREDEERVYLKVAEAGQRVLRIYRQLHRAHLVNYTYLSTHHLFMAGISFLYAIWHSPIVRSRLTMDEVDFTILAATSVLGDLIEKCPPAEACRDAFDRMAKATVQMCMNTTGFGSSTQSLNSRANRNHSKAESGDYFGYPSNTQLATANARQQRRATHRPSSAEQMPQPPPPRAKPQFDMSLNDIYTSTSTNVGSETQPLTRSQDPSQSPYQLTSSSSTMNNGTTRGGVKSEFPPPDNSSFAIPRNPAHTPSDYSISPPIDPSLLPSPQAGQAQLSQSSSSSSYLPQDPNLAAAMYGTSNNNNNNDASNSAYDFSLQNLDFLQGIGGIGGGGGGAGLDGNGGGAAGDGGAGDGLDLGFGYGWEGMDHDFSEGNQVDLFDGFFFGGQSGGSGGGGYGGS